MGPLFSNNAVAHEFKETHHLLTREDAMRVIWLIIVALVGGNTAVSAACVRPEARSPTTWARLLTRSADIIMDAEVTQEQGAAQGRAALLHPLIIYKGTANSDIAMALPPSSDRIITEEYPGFYGRLGQRRFVILYRKTRGYESDICTQTLARRPEIRAAIIWQVLKTRHASFHP